MIAPIKRQIGVHRTNQVRELVIVKKINRMHRYEMLYVYPYLALVKRGITYFYYYYYYYYLGDEIGTEDTTKGLRGQ